MGKVDLVMKRWEKQLEEFERLSFEDAKNLYNKAMTADDDNLKKSYMNKLILGTLYVPYNFILNNGLTMFSSGTYDINDIISACNEVWIKRLYSGAHLDKSYFSDLFSYDFFSEIYVSLSGDNTFLFDRTGGIGRTMFNELFTKFLELKNSGIEFNYQDLVSQCYSKQRTVEKRFGNECFSLMTLFENIYRNLSADQDMGFNMGPTKAYNYSRFLLDMGYKERLSENLEAVDFEDKIIDDIIYSEVVADVDQAIEKPRSRQIVHEYFGLDGEECKTLNEIADMHNISQERVRQILNKGLMCEVPRKNAKYR